MVQMSKMFSFGFFIVGVFQSGVSADVRGCAYIHILVYIY